jgi:hypothetical protein
LKDKNRNERLDQLSDALFGAPDDLSAAEAVEDLKAAGVDPEELCLRMYEKLCVVAREYRMREEQVPPLLRKALEDLGKSVGPAKTKEEADRRADSTISRLLEAVKAPLPQAFGTPGLVFNASFRNKASEQSAEDRHIIEKLEKELASAIDKEEKENQD